MQFIIGALMIAAGIFFVVKTDLLVQWFGHIAWAEDKLGSGGTWSFYKILGVIVIILAFMVMSGDIKTGSDATESILGSTP